MITKSLKTTKRASLALSTLLSAFVVGTDECPAAGVDAYEAMQCSAIRASQGADPTVCADVALPSCSPPDWFPAEPDVGVDFQLKSYLMSDSGPRLNDVTVRLTEWDKVWEHTWYSPTDVSFGPEIPRYGHEWNEYDFGALVKSVSCDIRGRFSYP